MEFDKSKYSETQFVFLEQNVKLPSSFAIITAEYPHHKDGTSKIENIIRNNNLKHDLIQNGYDFNSVLGCSEDFEEHCEFSYIIEIKDFNIACDIGLKHEQESIFFVKDGNLYYSDCQKETRKLIKIGLFSNRISQFNF